MATRTRHTAVCSRGIEELSVNSDSEDDFSSDENEEEHVCREVALEEEIPSDDDYSSDKKDVLPNGEKERKAAINLICSLG